VPASCRARRARLHYVEREDPGGRAPPTARHHDHHAAAELRHATTHVPRTRILAPPCTPTPPAAKPPAHDHHRTSNGNLPGPLDNHLLTLVMHASAVVLSRLCLTPNWLFCARDLGSGIPDQGSCSWSGRRACAHPAGALYRLAVVLMLAAAPPAPVAGSRARCSASAPAPVITRPRRHCERSRAVLQARPGVPPIRTLLTAVSGPAMVRN
jgi:hypothetical protein